MSISAKEITASFDEAIAELKSLYDDANEVMNSDKGELFLSPLLSEINRLYSLIQHLVIAESDESAKCEIERKLNAQHIVKSRFDKAVNRYLADKKTKFPASMISGPRTLRSRSGVSRHSSASNRFHAEAVAKKEIARLRLSQLQERQEMERQEEERKIDEMRRSVEREIEEKRRSAEHHRKLQILEATHVWNEASLQQQVASEEFEHGGYISDGEIQDATGKSFEETSNAKLSLQSSKVSPEHALEVIIPVEHSTADRGKTASVKNKLTPKGETSVKSIERANTVCDVLQGESGTSSSCNNASIDALQTVIASLKSSVDCPKLELLKFNGNPMAYHRFMMTFAATIESAVPDNRRLLYLLQYCEGKAKELIEHCALLEPGEGYEKAKEILYENYGRRSVIARAYIKKLVKGPVIRSDDSNALIKLAQELEECNTTLRFMKYYSDVNNFDNIAKIVGRLSFSMQSRWLRFAASLEKQDREPSFEDLVGFVKNESEIAKSSYSGVLFKTGKKPGIKISTHATNVTEAKGKLDSRWNNPRSSMPTRKQTEVKCGLCSSNHFLWSCPKFRTMNQESKYKYIRDQRLCFNCLKGGHVQRDCQSQRKCTVSGCGRKHHFLLHRDQPNRQARTPETTSSPNENSTMTPSAEGASESSKCFACATNAKSQAFLNIVPVRISAGKKTVCCFAFLDQGSTTSLCDERLLKELDITGEKTSFTLSTLNNSAAQVGSKVDLMVSSLSDSGNLRLKNVLSVNKLPVRPNQPLKHSGKACWTHLQKLKIPHLENQEVMLLIGVDTPEAFWIEDELRGKPGEPYAIKTMLGWSLIGPATGETSEVSANFMTTDESLEQQVRSMWELERHFSTGIECQMSRNDRYALRIMKDSTVLTEDGHYQLALPWRPGAPQLESNKNQAAVRLAYLKKRLEKDAELQKRYVNVVESYITNGFARRVNEADNEAPGRWFLPHHPVFHPHKPDKVRVVFDCGARHKGKSLNDQLLKGPDLMNNLVGVLSRFRMENVAIVADVEAMFHQVKVDPRDHSYLRFLWWPDGDLSQPFHEYCMQVHLFGATSSPACANFCLKQAAIDQADVFSAEAVETVKQNFYMDDCLKSVSSEEEAILLVSQLSALLKNRGFRLTKWLSNKSKALSNLDKEDISEAAWNLEKMTDSCQRVLGVCWNYANDNFEFSVHLKDKPFTRRGILSVVASLFDPLGFVAPVTLSAKLLLQELCRKGFGWDEAIPEEESSYWFKWLQSLKSISQLKVPRCLILNGAKFNDLTVELHTFSDASAKAYSAVSYLKTIDFAGHVHCSFVMGKCRLAPIKAVSIPRLELMGAALAVKLAQIIKHELGGEQWQSYFWSDSTSVLYMINNSEKRFPVFVANRLSKIDEGSTPDQWRYVDTKSNPADDATRGLTSENLTINSRWFSGPLFLLEDRDCWPAGPCEFPKLPDEFLILQKSVSCMNLEVSKDNFDFRFCRFSSWKRLRSSVAWILRLKLKLRRKRAVPEGPLSVDELEEAENEIIACVQRSGFEKEISSLSELSKSNPLRKLRPIVHQGLLRVGGRLRNARENFDVKHPIILPSSHHVTRLLIEDHHRLMGHSGMASTWTSLRQRFWIVKGAATVRKILGKCLFCRKRNASPGKQIMADLPEGRLSVNNPVFYVTGVDYFGPFEIKQGRSYVKRYGCLFTCLSTRAVHIEVAPSLTADAFINALRRFVSRRGTPHTIHSDNGTNLTGGCKELRDAIRKLNESKVYAHLRKKNIRWNFNPPQASHMGGVWERLIRSTRRIFNALLSSQTLTDDLLVTLMTEAESIINSRPLTPILLDPDAEEPLTPNHLLMMRSSTSLPGLFKGTDCYSQKRWRQVQYLADQFWLRFCHEYLQTLQVRQKWLKKEPNFSVNDLVLMYDENAPRGSWPLGKVVEVYPDSQGNVRQVLVRTKTQTFKRPISKLCRLKLESQWADEPK